MLHRIAFLSAAFAVAAGGAALLPQAASAADYPGWSERPAPVYGRYDGDGGFGGAPVPHRRDPRAEGREGRWPGPVVFDERGPDRRFGAPDDEGFDRGPPVAFRPARGYDGFDRPASADGPMMVPAYRPVVSPAYRPVAAPVYGEAFEGRADLPDVGCTVEEAQSTTAAGWRKTVTHRTCYRR